MSMAKFNQQHLFKHADSTNRFRSKLAKAVDQVMEESGKDILVNGFTVDHFKKTVLKLKFGTICIHV
jgi:hypothetical protein